MDKYADLCVLLIAKKHRTRHDSLSLPERELNILLEEQLIHPSKDGNKAIDTWFDENDPDELPEWLNENILLSNNV